MILKGTSLAALLNDRIDSLEDDNTSRGDIISEMARASRISESTVGQILSGGINCPPINRLEGFASALDVSMTSIISAAERDGCEYDKKSGLAKFCRLAAPENESDMFNDEIKRIESALKV